MKNYEQQYKSYGAEDGADGGIFSAITHKLQAMQAPFLDMLSQVTHRDAGTCAVATYALVDGFEGDSGYTPHAKGMHIFLNREYVTGLGGFYKPAYGFHTLFSLTNPEGESLAVDPMYHVLNPSWKGKFLITKPESLGAFYYTSTEGSSWAPPWGSPWKRWSTQTPLAAEDLDDITDQKEQQVNYLKKAFGMTDNGYQSLVGLVKEHI